MKLILCFAMREECVKFMTLFEEKYPEYLGDVITFITGIGMPLTIHRLHILRNSGAYSQASDVIFVNIGYAGATKDLKEYPVGHVMVGRSVKILEPGFPYPLKDGSEFYFHTAIQEEGLLNDVLIEGISKKVDILSSYSFVKASDIEGKNLKETVFDMEAASYSLFPSYAVFLKVISDFPELEGYSAFSEFVEKHNPFENVVEIVKHIIDVRIKR